MAMINYLIADLLVVVHLIFIIFVVLGGLIVLKHFKFVFLHLPAAAWGMMIEFFGWVCPLTPLENHYRQLAGEGGYTGGFIDHYIIPIIYPSGLTPVIQFVLGIGALAINLIIYGFIFRKIKKNH